jgi:hypothetical protein
VGGRPVNGRVGADVDAKQSATIDDDGFSVGVRTNGVNRVVKYGVKTT